MKEEYNERYKERLKRMVKFIELDAPVPIIGHAALLIADLALPDEPGRWNLIRYLIDGEKRIADYLLALDNPDSEESKEAREIEKMIAEDSK